jgi:hypothetical protein
MLRKGEGHTVVGAGDKTNIQVYDGILKTL